FAVSTLPWGAIAARELTGLDKKTYAKAKIADASAIKVGEAVEFAYPEKHDSALLVRLGDNEYKAYQNTCTHLKCPVFWSGERGELVCPCHHVLYDVQTGIPFAGPPRRTGKRYARLHIIQYVVAGAHQLPSLSAPEYRAFQMRARILVSLVLVVSESDQQSGIMLLRVSELDGFADFDRARIGNFGFRIRFFVQTRQLARGNRAPRQSRYGE
ncbi:hypothetical protein CV019_02405, partial [Staphylococcus haemolyticus]